MTKLERPVRLIIDREAGATTEGSHLPIAGAQNLAGELNGAAAGLDGVDVNGLGGSIRIACESAGGDSSGIGKGGGNGRVERLRH